MKTNILLVLLASTTLLHGALSTQVDLDLGESRVNENFIFRNFSDLNGTRIEGQTMSVDFSFNGDFVRLFTATSKDFGLSLDIVMGSYTTGGIAYSGTGYLTGQNGLQVSPTQTLITGGGISLQGQLIVAGLHLFPMQDEHRNFNLSYPTPLDFYGVHFDFILPQTATTVVTNSHLALHSSRSNQTLGFGVGPGALPADIVPDGGNSLFLLALASVALMVARLWSAPRLKWTQ